MFSSSLLIKFSSKHKLFECTRNLSLKENVFIVILSQEIKLN